MYHHVAHVILAAAGAAAGSRPPLLPRAVRRVRACGRLDGLTAGGEPALSHDTCDGRAGCAATGHVCKVRRVDDVGLCMSVHMILMTHMVLEQHDTLGQHECTLSIMTL